jgi:hypothetical protein
VEGIEGIIMEITQRIKRIEIVFGIVMASFLAVSADGHASGVGDVYRAKGPNNRKAASTKKANANKANAKKKRDSKDARPAAKPSPSTSKGASNSASPEIVRLTSYVKFGNGSSYVIYSNGQKFRKGPVPKKTMKSRGKSGLQWNFSGKQEKRYIWS